MCAGREKGGGAYSTINLCGCMSICVSSAKIVLVLKLKLLIYRHVHPTAPSGLTVNLCSPDGISPCPDGISPKFSFL